MNRSAVLSDCGQYRYLLSREWGDPGWRLTFVMLNPSTADAEVDDPTIRRCIRFAQRGGYGAIDVVNLFAYRATKPTELARVADPVGPRNNVFLHDYAPGAVAAWGAHPAAHHRYRAVVDLCGGRQPVMLCLGTTASGAPRHPLYVRGDQPFIRWFGGEA